MVALTVPVEIITAAAISVPAGEALSATSAATSLDWAIWSMGST
jgi:hypothetical protein